MDRFAFLAKAPASKWHSGGTRISITDTVDCPTASVVLPRRSACCAAVGCKIRMISTTVLAERETGFARSEPLRHVPETLVTSLT